MTGTSDTLTLHERQLRARAIRRQLSDINPNSTNRQEQSLFFLKLPAEIRFLIYQFLLSQICYSDRPFDNHYLSRLGRPGHTHHTKVHTAILLTCRLVYYEAHTIPMRSATHHPQYPDYADWLNYMTKQQGVDAYHLHDRPFSVDQHSFTRFFQPHLHWKRITWSLCKRDWPAAFSGDYKMIDELTETLAAIELPASCQEVNVEFDFGGEVPESRQLQARLCEKLGFGSAELSNEQKSIAQPGDSRQSAGLERTDGSRLSFDATHSKQYSWIGYKTRDWRSEGNVEFRTIRLCWRARVPERGYMSYDHMDCLNLSYCNKVRDIQEDRMEE
ncbi:hypothetical protein C7974DRAFT_371037 [Boeremia exigua]|uniref:uncharacterized protein n=1 Tax=Boeremia exigua TaxID=749465 RepID=UPI001E8CAF03|nr:uncharacterized protein C7974DRAFT_371037 [Boeremia exigua]KAH6643846.1 hypothetical protein C7974DRAFT_371037 [Boeremia exigua]